MKLEQFFLALNLRKTQVDKTYIVSFRKNSGTAMPCKESISQRG